MSLEELRSKKDDVLNETVAQGILQELTDLRGLGGSHNKRWALELIQNALDASNEEGVDVVFEMNENGLTFSHNGRAFKEEELIHLIFHGSTKVESESASGKLGTGFLSTHLLSPIVKVTGTLHAQQKFSFTLDRDAETLNELTSKMKKTWQELEDSLVDLVDKDVIETTFLYPLQSDGSKSICKEGLETIKQLVPVIIAFQEKLSSVTIKENGDEYLWKRGGIQSEVIEVDYKLNGKEVDNDISGMLVKELENVKVGIPVILLYLINFPLLKEVEALFPL